MTSLILPEHVAKARDAKKVVEAETPAQPQDLSNAYVAAEDRVLDPSRLPQSALDRLPQPTGWRLRVLPYKGKAKTKGDIYLPDEYVERMSLATVVAYVLAVGPDCYLDSKKFQNGPWCKKGDWIILGRYAGARFRIEGGEVRIINDDEVIATIANPEDILNV